MRRVAIGLQDFADVRKNNYFYIDKTPFIKDWWESGDSVTLIARPRRFGKTLNMSMLDYFFSLKHAGRSELFEGLEIWKDEKYRALQGTYPVINLSFAEIMEDNYKAAEEKIKQQIVNIYKEYDFLLQNDKTMQSLSVNMSTVEATAALCCLSRVLHRYYGKKVIIILNGYDMPIRSAYRYGYCKEMLYFMRSLFLSTFKTNTDLERGIIAGVMNFNMIPLVCEGGNFKTITAFSGEYAGFFGFNEKEVLNALEEYGYEKEREKVKDWYGGFSFGKSNNLYNPWSVVNFLAEGNLNNYWISDEDMWITKLLNEAGHDLKDSLGKLVDGEKILCDINEYGEYDLLIRNSTSIWSFLLDNGYLKIVGRETDNDWWEMYELALTNYEVRKKIFKMMNF